MPYLTDLSPAAGGRIFYNEYDCSSNTAETITATLAVRQLVEEKYMTSFQPVFIIKATWEQVIVYSHPEEVSFQS